MLKNNRVLCVTLLGLVTLSFLCADEPYFSRLDKFQTPVPYPGVRGWHLTQNLGPTGARGWMCGNNPSRADTLDSREILVKSVEAGSPADGTLRPYDIILGVAKAPGQAPERFTADARLAFARAITMAESSKGKGALSLLRWRNGEVQHVTLQIPVLGDYAATAPFDCPKTRQLVEQAASWVAAQMPAHGDNGMIGAINGLFLLATGEERYLDHVRRTAYRLASEPFSDGGHNTWRWGYVNLFLCEYYLATGDARVLPRIQEYSEQMANGQCNPGTWGHKSVEGRIPPGYGSMNQAGLIAFMSLVTAHQIGVPFDYSAIAHSISFYGSYAGRGGIPYGDHAPAADSSCNGKNGSAAVTFHMLGAEPAAQWFARLCASANLGSFEGGHTGNFFNQLWTPLGAALSGRENTQNFWARFNSYRDLARRRDGSFVTQPLPHVREGDLGFGNYIRKGPDWSTAAFALSYLVANGELAILGRTRSVFGADLPDVLKPAVDLYGEKRFADCMQALEPLIGSADPVVKELALQLNKAAKRSLRSLDLTLADMQNQLAKGDLFLLKQQLQGLVSIVDPADPRLTAFHGAINNPDHAERIGHGEQYHALIGGYTILGRDGFVSFAPRPQLTDRRALGTITSLAVQANGFYQEQARALLDAFPPEPETTQMELVAKLVADQPVVQQSFQIPDPARLSELILTWDLNVGGGMRILLNGTTIMDVSIDPGPWRTARNTPIPLKPITLELLKPGENVLTVQLHPDRTVKEASCRLEAIVTP